MANFYQNRLFWVYLRPIFTDFTPNRSLGRLLYFLMTGLLSFAFLQGSFCPFSIRKMPCLSNKFLRKECLSQFLYLPLPYIRYPLFKFSAALGQVDFLTDASIG